MGTQESFALGKQKFTAPELSSFVLRSLRSDAESFLGREVSRAVITVPAYFNDLQRRATRLAGELAGLEVVRVINEPTAAALTYGYHGRDLRQKLMVIDLGGGTFDVTIMEVFDRMLEIVATSGESMLGGEDFTDRFAAQVLKLVGLQTEIVEWKHPLQWSRLKQQCELAKLQFQDADEAMVVIPDENGQLDSAQAPIPVRRADFQEWMQPLLQRLMSPIERALRDAQLGVEDLDDILLVGGATRMACLRSFLSEPWNRELRCEFNPDEVVALGAAVQAALIADNAAVEDMVLTDVCPHTLGVEISKQLGGHLLGGYFEPIIHRNTTIPVSKEKSFATLVDNQTEVLLRVYQGEGRRAEENLLLGELKIDKLPPAPAGSAFDVRFSYDPSGILEVEVVIDKTGARHRAVISHPNAHWSPAQIDATLKKLQKIKFYPRDQLENQLLLRYSERLLGELPPTLREEFDEVLDFFEHGMRSGDPATFEKSRHRLEIWLSSHGFSWGEDSAHE
jgi:molecular chaperone HscC